MKIVVTKLAAAHVEIEIDTPITISISDVCELRPAPVEAEVGASILYFMDGSTVNVVESPGEVRAMLQRSKRHYFQRGFSRN